MTKIDFTQNLSSIKSWNFHIVYSKLGCPGLYDFKILIFLLSFFRNSVLAPLIFRPTNAFVQLLNDFIQNHVFIDDDEEDQDDHSKIKELHKRRNFLASFCKLIIYNVLPTKVGADIFKHYVVSQCDAWVDFTWN